MGLNLKKDYTLKSMAFNASIPSTTFVKLKKDFLKKEKRQT